MLIRQTKVYHSRILHFLRKYSSGVNKNVPAHADVVVIGMKQCNGYKYTQC